MQGQSYAEDVGGWGEDPKRWRCIITNSSIYSAWLLKLRWLFTRGNCCSDTFLKALLASSLVNTAGHTDAPIDLHGELLNLRFKTLLNRHGNSTLNVDHALTTSTLLLIWYDSFLPQLKSTFSVGIYNRYTKKSILDNIHSFAEDLYRRSWTMTKIVEGRTIDKFQMPNRTLGAKQLDKYVKSFNDRRRIPIPGEELSIEIAEDVSVKAGFLDPDGEQTLCLDLFSAWCHCYCWTGVWRCQPIGPWGPFWGNEQELIRRSGARYSSTYLLMTHT